MYKIALYIVLALSLGGFVELFVKGTTFLFVAGAIFVSPFLAYFLGFCCWLLWTEVLRPFLGDEG